MNTTQPWTPWRVEQVVDADVPAFALRTYLEHADVRVHLQRVTQGHQLESACEIGCAYGRMIVVLTEFARRVEGFEREPGFVQIARRLHPAITSHQVPSLGQLPAADRSFDLVMTFTVLQHLTERALLPALTEVRRLVKPGGLVLLCEETNLACRFGNINDDRNVCVIGRTVSSYATLLAPLLLIGTSPRRIEPTYTSKDVGTYMLFQAPR